VPSLAGVHVLALDDNADSLALMEAVLAACGARVSAAQSVAEALQIVGRDRPDLVLSDIAMPGDDGYALIQALHASPDEAVRALPVAAITAYASAEDRARLLAAGFQAHLAKPVDPTELAALACVLTGRSPTGGHAEPAAPVADHAATALKTE